jgi:hypothetical protein
LKFLRRISNASANWSDVTYESIISTIAKHVLRFQFDEAEGRIRGLLVVREAIELLFSFSFHEETAECFRTHHIFAALSSFTKVPEVRGPLIKLFYKVASVEGLDEDFRNEELLNMLISATTVQCEERMVALAILTKLSMDRSCAAQIAASDVFTPENLRSIFVQATSRNQSSDSKSLLKMIRNVADTQPGLVSGFDQEIIEASLRNSGDMENLCDIFAISSRAKMTSARAKFFTGNREFLTLLDRILANRKALPQLHLECIMFVSSVVLWAEPAKTMGPGIVTRVVDVFWWFPDDLDIQAQCMFCFVRFICHGETRAALLSRPKVIDVVLQHYSSQNLVLSSIANSLINILVAIDSLWQARIQLPRFMAFNKDWLKTIGS